MNSEIPNPHDLQMLLAKIRLLNHVDSQLTDIAAKAENLDDIFDRLKAKAEDVGDTIQNCSYDLSDCEAAIESCSKAADGLAHSVAGAEVTPNDHGSEDEHGK